MALALVLAAAPAPAAAETLGRSAAIARGRVLYVKGRRLMLDRRMLARGRFAGFDLTPDRAVWAVGRPGGFQRIVLERL